jgi:hypothetical protein
MPGCYSDDHHSFLTILDNAGGRLWVKSELTGISINLKASQKELEGVRKMVLRRTSPRRSSGSMSTATSLGPTLKKKYK